MKKKNYPKWIDEYAKAFHKGFIGMVPISWGPVDAISLISSLKGTFLSKIYQAVKKIKEKKYSIDKIAGSFSSPSSLRVALYFLILEYQYSQPKKKEQFKEIVEFFVKSLKHMTKKDTFVCRSNITHSLKEIDDILNTFQWKRANKEIFREIGKLYNSLFSLVFALYGDFFPQDSHEIYGPYNASRKFGKNSILLIKHFPKIKCINLWPKSSEIKKLKYKDVKIFQIFKNIKFQCEIIGMHSVYEGNLMNNLISYAILVDGKYRNKLSEIKKLNDYFSEIALKQSIIYGNLTKEKSKKKVLEWECYQFFNFFKLAKIDWRPTKEMIKAIKNKKVSNRYELKQIPSFKEYQKSKNFEIYWLRNLYN